MGLLSNITEEEHKTIMMDLINADTTKSVEQFNRAIDRILKAKKESKPDDAFMGIKYDAFAK